MKSFKQFITESEDHKDVLDHIHQSYADELKHRKSDYSIASKHEGNSTTLKFMKDGISHNSVAFELEKHGDKHHLKLVDQYLPHDLKAKGFTTAALKRVRNHPKLSGKARASVGMNPEGWKKIIKRSGFEHYEPEPHPMFRKKT